MKYLDDSYALSDDYSNILKGRVLEEATEASLKDLKIPFQDTTRVYNGIVGFIPLDKEIADGGIPDFILPNRCVVIEAKNWETKKYRVDVRKVKKEILCRFSSFPYAQHVLIIPRSKWDREARELLKRAKVTVIELKEVVTYGNLRTAVAHIKYWLKRFLHLKPFKVANPSIWIEQLTSHSSLARVCPCHRVDCLYSCIGCLVGRVDCRIGEGEPPPVKQQRINAENKQCSSGFHKQAKGRKL